MGGFTRSMSDGAFINSLIRRAATSQGGVFSGDNPADYNASDPIRLWVIQVVIIIAMTQLLALIFGRIRQPRVIAEVIGGVLLGPTVMGRIPNFKQSIFPDVAMPLLNLTATIGLVLFLFLVGLEIDTRLMKRNIKAATAVSVAGLLVPLGLGAALGVGVYREFIDPAVNFGYFVLFVAVAVGITAFPVLCRILTELKLLDTTVGVVVLSAGVGNDVVGWVLLALTVALVNASTGLVALYVLLTSVGYWGYLWLCRRTGSLEQGSPTALMMTVTLLIVFISAFFTDIIGVHAIFGGFLAGLIIPHENGFAISLVEKIEDLVTILFLPLYFTLSGLRTNLGLLDNGITWGYTILICVVAFSAKFFACGAAALGTGFNWRESGAIGSLMSCKGLVELIVLNVGLQAGILDTRVFSMFVVHAIILTFITTPLTLMFYPSKYRVHTGGAIVKSTPPHTDTEARGTRPSLSESAFKTRFAVVLDKIEQLPAAMTLAQLLHPFASTGTVAHDGGASTNIVQKHSSTSPNITIDALRLIELTTRTSAVLKSTESSSLLQSDAVLSVFRTFGQLNKLLISAALSVVPHDEFATAISTHVSESATEMVILPWSRGSNTEEDAAGARKPFDGIFHKSSASSHDQTSSVVYSEFIRRVFMGCPSDVALFVDRGSNLNTGALQFFLPFFGGPDDRLALSFLMQLCVNPEVKATVVRVVKTDNALTSTSSVDDKGKNAELVSDVLPSLHYTVTAADTVYDIQNTVTRLASDTADNIAWNRYTQKSATYTPDTAVLSALSRMTFVTEEASDPLHRVLDLVKDEVAQSGRNVIVVAGRSRRLAALNHTAELGRIVAEKGSAIGSSVSKTVGDVGAALVADGTAASLLVVQAAARTN
ncbi:potassium:hydrogen antiporter [Hymenopellis radicata]|nr:potassium:hydrogen antiporter [Hymenopellis radicata]